MVTWLGCGAFVGEIGGLCGRPVDGGVVTFGGESATRCCGAWVPDTTKPSINSTII